MSKPKDWRIVGQYFNGQTFLFVMGHSEDECMRLMHDQIDEWSYDELKEVCSIWLERWRGCWVTPPDDINIRKYRSRAYRRDKQSARSAT